MSAMNRKARHEAEKRAARDRQDADKRSMSNVRSVLDDIDAGRFHGCIGNWLIHGVARTEAYHLGEPEARALAQRAAEVVSRFEADQAYQDAAEAKGRAALKPFTGSK